MNTFGLDTWSTVFTQSYQSLWWSFVQFAPRLIIAIVLFIIGWILGSLIARAIEQVFASIKVDSLFRSIGAENFFRKAGMNLNTGYFVGQVVRWFIIIVFLLPSLSLVLPGGDQNGVSMFLQNDVLGYLPRVIIAVFVLIIAAFVSDLLSKFIASGSRSMNVHAANMLGTVAKYAVWIFAFIIALSTLGVAEYYMSVLFTGIILMFSLGGALAFGLGGKDAAARFINKLGEEVHHG
jgi:hypothetical protein